MKIDRVTRIVLIVIAASLAVLAFSSLFRPTPALARPADDSGYDLYVEPGTTTIKAPDGTSQYIGKMMIDMRTGNIWGFPTLNTLPYPVDSTKSTPPVSHAIYLGRFDLADTAK